MSRADTATQRPGGVFGIEHRGVTSWRPLHSSVTPARRILPATPRTPILDLDGWQILHADVPPAMVGLQALVESTRARCSCYSAHQSWPYERGVLTRVWWGTERAGVRGTKGGDAEVGR